MPMKNLDDLFVHMLRDVFYAERQIQKTLPRMARKAQSEELREAFEQHAEETGEQIEKLERIFEMRDLKPRGTTCDAMNGILEEAKEIMSECEDKDALDAALIASAQAVEHYEIARYGTMAAWARQLGMDEAASIIAEILTQEKATDDKLSQLAETSLNQQAAA